MSEEDEKEAKKTRTKLCADRQKVEIAARNATRLPGFYTHSSPKGKFHRNIPIIKKSPKDMESKVEGTYPQGSEARLLSPGSQKDLHVASWGLRHIDAEWRRHTKLDVPDEKIELLDKLSVMRLPITFSSALFGFRDGRWSLHQLYVQGTASIRHSERPGHWQTQANIPMTIASREGLGTPHKA